jgi:hypothetical protein
LAIARKLIAAEGDGNVTVTKVPGPGGLLFTGTKGQKLLTAATFRNPGDKLGDTAVFTQVIPDVGTSDFALYVDLTKVIPMLNGGKPEASLRPLKAVGMTASGGTEPTFRLRISVR